jgi:C-terminal processing protease CtpA/Prc
MKKFSKILFFVSIIFVVIFLFGGKKIFRVLSDHKKDHQYLSLVSEITDLIKTRYVEKVDPGLKFPGAFTSMLNSLDEYSAYLDPKKSKIYRLFQDGSAFSLGIFGRKYKNHFYITGVFTDSPAQKAGLEYGDFIQAVNGKSLSTFSFWEMFLSFFSEKPENIDLVIKKVNSNQIKKITLRTDRLSTSIAAKKINNNTCLITLNRIDPQVVQLLNKVMIKNVKSKWIIDLRQYSGGDLKSFLELSRLLINKTFPVFLKTKNQVKKFLFGSDKTFQFKGLVIIDTSTILYSELLAFFLKKENKILVGSETPGFMPYLNQYLLKDGSSVLLKSGFFTFQNSELTGKSVKPQFESTEKDPVALLKYCLRLLKNIK